MIARDARNAYDAWHAELGVDAENRTPWHDMVREHLSLESLRGQQVLEIGCGRGDFSCWLARELNGEATQVAGDFSPTAVSMARDYAESHALEVEWRVMDIQNIAAADNSFDTVFSCETIEHVPDPARAVRELARVLKPGGRLFLTTPNYLNAMGLYRGYMRLRGTPFTETGQPINNFVTLPRTLRWVRRAGLRALQAESRGIYLPIPGRPWTKLAWLDRPRWITSWMGLHSFVMATKP
jgi:2-polyprenyl-3-methyl-5-hydroxy-6-metoxy-1,4-benzoquinol methylase